jgi:hypothetical protein
VRDRAVHDAVWGMADEQPVAQAVRDNLRANGIKVGVITGGLPAEVDAALNAPPPQKRVERPEFNLPDGSNTLVSLTESKPQATLLLNRQGRPIGRDYTDASGFFRVTATQEGPTGVALRLAPEIHHGAIARRFGAVSNGLGTLNTLEPLSINDRQEEETFHGELTTSLTLQPDQVVVLGCDPDRRGSLGAFLFTQPEPNSDRLLQRVVIVWASRNNTGIPGSHPKPSEPPRLIPVDPADLPELPGRTPRVKS